MSLLIGGGCRGGNCQDRSPPRPISSWHAYFRTGALSPDPNRGAIAAKWTYLLVTLYAHTMGFHERGPNDLDLWTEPDPLLGGNDGPVLTCLTGMLHPGVAGDFFLVSDAGLVHIGGRGMYPVEGCNVHKSGTAREAAHVPFGPSLLFPGPHRRPLLIRDV